MTKLWFTVLVLAHGAESVCTEEALTPLLNALFSSLGNDCDKYNTLFSADAQYYHQHDGFKNKSQLLANCNGYAGFCPPGDCKFQQNGDAFVHAEGEKCHMLVPYLWAEIPANNKVPNNLEPHNGWEYIIATPDSSTEVGYTMDVFGEIETSYSVHYNWAQPADASAYNLTVDLLKKAGGSDGSCDMPISSVVTQYFTATSNGTDVWRQQGAAVVLAAGGVCHVLAPYAAEVGGVLSAGHMVFQLVQNASLTHNYKIKATDDFPLGSDQTTPDACATNVAPLLSALFSSLGNDCDKYNTLFSADAQYYHQHDGFKNKSQLLANCNGYAGFCPPGDCKFQQNGAGFVHANGEKCHMLVPYLWAEIPANNKVPNNLEPHNGWEYIIATPDSSTEVGYTMDVFGEIETSYSVHYNWAQPADASAYNLTVDLLKKAGGSDGSCDMPISSVVTRYFTLTSTGTDVWRQQGDAVVLAAGGVCHVLAPYAAEVGGMLESGNILFTLKPLTDGSDYEKSFQVDVFPLMGTTPTPVVTTPTPENGTTLSPVATTPTPENGTNTTNPQTSSASLVTSTVFAIMATLVFI